jgi:5'-3' exoribonuclease 1
MEFIRKMKQESLDFSEHQSHCIFGMDADLIMLALSTHFPHITVLRESLIKKSTRPVGIFVSHNL